MRARRARRPSPRWFRATPEQVCGEGTKYLLVLAQPRVPLRAVMSSRPVMFALLPLGFVLAVLLCAVAGAFTTHLVVSG